MRQALPLLKKKLDLQENVNTMDFLENVCGEQKSNCGPLGRIVHKTLNESELKAIEEAGFPVPTSAVPTFPRYKHGELSLSAAKAHNS